MEEKDALENNHVYYEELTGAPEGAEAFEAKHSEQLGGGGIEEGVQRNEAKRETNWPLTLTPTQLRELALSREVAQDHMTQVWRTRKPIRETELEDALESEYARSLEQAIAENNTDEIKKINTEIDGYIYRTIRKERAETERSAYRRLEQAILANDTDAIREIAADLGATEERNIRALLDCLSSDLSAEDVLERTHDFDFLRWLANASIPRHTGIPTADGEYIISGLASRVSLYPNENQLALLVRPYNTSGHTQTIVLPLDQQHIAWSSDEDIYGNAAETIQSQMEVFGALAARTNSIYTHVTGDVNLPGIITSEAFGNKSGLRGATAGAQGLDGTMTEEVALHEGATELSSLVEGTFNYIITHDSGPIILFNKAVTEHRQTIPNPGGIGIVGGTQLNDPDLIGIWVNPTYRKHLLNWISAWSPEEVARVFKGRSPESLLISSADHLTEQYTPNDRDKAPDSANKDAGVEVPTIHLGEEVKKHINDALDEEPFIPEHFIQALKESPEIAELFEGNGRKVEAHTLKVMHQLERYFATEWSSPILGIRQMRQVAGYHDIGKKLALDAGDKRLQHAYTKKLAPQILQELEADSQDITNIIGIIDQDFLGNLIKEGQSPQFVAELIKQRVRALGVELQDYVDLLTKFYKVDAGAYTVDAGGIEDLDHLFIFDRDDGGESGTMRFSSEAQNIYDQLMRELDNTH